MIYMKAKILILILLVAIILISCENVPPQAEVHTSTTAIDGETSTPSTQKYNNLQLDFDPTSKIVYNNVYGRYGTDGPIKTGETYFTPLANAIIGTSKSNETLFFLVCIEEPLPEDYDHIAANNSRMNYVYNGVSIGYMEQNLVAYDHEDFNQQYEALSKAYAEYFLPVHQNPSDMIPTPIRKLKKPESSHVPISRPMPNVIRAQPQR